MCHAGDGAKRNERILAQVLTFFSGDNGLRLEIELQNESVEHVNGVSLDALNPIKGKSVYEEHIS